MDEGARLGRQVSARHPRPEETPATCFEDVEDCKGKGIEHGEAPSHSTIGCSPNTHLAAILEP